MRHLRLLRLQGLARQWLGELGNAGSTPSTSASGYSCPVLTQERAVLRQRMERYFGTSRMVMMSDAPEPSVKRSNVAPVSMRTLILALMAGAGITYATRVYTDEKLQKSSVQSQQVVGQASVGGPFELIDQDGKKFTDRDLRGEFALLYFGFTHCPDICPDELEKVAEAVTLIEKWTAANVRPVFISVDPKRDKPAICKEYVREFHPRMVGLTGDMDRIKAVSKSYRVYYNKTGESETDYLVDHSIIHYLVDPDGEFVTFFGKNTDAQQLALQVLDHMAEWQRNHPTYNQGLLLKAPAAVKEGAAAATK